MPNGLRVIAGIVVLVVWLSPFAREPAPHESVAIVSEASAVSLLGIARASPSPVSVGNEQTRQPTGIRGGLPAESVNLLIGVIGALVGATVTYYFTMRQRDQEIAARSKVLIAALLSELNDIEEVLPPYVAGRIYYRDPIRLSALPQLLEGSTLDSRTDAELIGVLISMHTATSTYNDFAASFNVAQMTRSIPANVHGEMYENLGQRHRRVIEHMKDLIERLAKRSTSGERDGGSRSEPA